MRLLAIASGDFGEFGTAMYFLEGLRGAAEPVVLLLPESLMRSTRVSMSGVDIRNYSCLEDVRRVIAETRPEAVVLTSGYLLPINSGLSLLDTVRLLRLLRRERVTLLTSDPFVGLLRSRALDFRDLYTHGRIRPPAFARSWRFALPLFVVRSMLRNTCHIYPMPIDDLRPARYAQRLSFCSAPAEVKPAQPASPPTWLFVLSSTELALQVAAHGVEFVDKLVARIFESVEAGRSAMLIGPDGLVADVRARVGSRAGITARSNVPYAEYLDILMAAEYVFFWNYLSFSIIHRVLAARPVFYFDEGHMVHILPDLGQEGVRVIYGGWRPALLSLDARLDEQGLAASAIEVSHQFRRIGAGLRSCPPPDEVLRRAAAS